MPLEKKTTKKINAPINTPKPKIHVPIKPLLPPPSYTNQVKYVQKHVLDDELSKLNSMKADLQNIMHLLDNMDLATVPDRGAKVISRLTELEAAVRQQGDLVGNLVVEPNQPLPADTARDGLKRLSGDDIQKASNAKQPKLVKQAIVLENGHETDDVALETTEQKIINLERKRVDNDAVLAQAMLQVAHNMEKLIASNDAHSIRLYNLIERLMTLGDEQLALLSSLAEYICNGLQQTI